MLRLAGSFNPRPKPSTGIQQMFHDVFYTRFTRLDNGLVESWNLYATLIDWHLNSGDSLHSLFDLNPTYEHLFEPFEISPGVVLSAGEYRFTPWRIFFTSARKRQVQGSIGLSFGNFWSGTAKTIQTGLSYKLPPRFSISLNTNQTFARLPQGNFVARIYSSQVNYAVSPFPIVLQPDPIRQPVRKSWPPEPRALDPRAGQRRFLRIRSGLGARHRARVRLQETRLEVGHETPVHVPLLSKAGPIGLAAICAALAKRYAVRSNQPSPEPVASNKCL